MKDEIKLADELVLRGLYAAERRQFLIDISLQREVCELRKWYYLDISVVKKAKCWMVMMQILIL